MLVITAMSGRSRPASASISPRWLAPDFAHQVLAVLVGGEDGHGHADQAVEIAGIRVHAILRLEHGAHVLLGGGLAAAARVTATCARQLRAVRARERRQSARRVSRTMKVRARSSRPPPRRRDPIRRAPRIPRETASAHKAMPVVALAGEREEEPARAVGAVVDDGTRPRRRRPRACDAHQVAGRVERVANPFQRA